MNFRAQHNTYMNQESQPKRSGIPPAALIFAHELSLATEKADGFITPLGTFENTVFLIGTLTEKIIRTGNVSGLRVSDPTGVFSLSMNWHNQTLMKRIDEIDVPSFVAITGFVRFRKYLGKTYLEIVPEVIEPANRKMRDDWIIASAEYAIKRLEKIPDSEIKQEFQKLLKTSLDTIKEETPSKDLSDEKLLEIISELSGKKGAVITQVIANAASFGMSEEKIKEQLARLLEDGECYTPTKETIKIA